VQVDTKPMRLVIAARAAIALTGSICACLPFFTRNGLPLSLQIICRPYDETTALRIGWAYEQASEWKERRPPDAAT